MAPLFEALKGLGSYRLLVTPDHPTPLRTKTHAHGYVPFAMAGAGIEPDGINAYDEVSAASSPLVFDKGWQLMDYFLK